MASSYQAKYMRLTKPEFARYQSHNPIFLKPDEAEALMDEILASRAARAAPKVSPSATTGERALANADRFGNAIDTILREDEIEGETREEKIATLQDQYADYSDALRARVEAVDPFVFEEQAEIEARVNDQAIDRNAHLQKSLGKLGRSIAADRQVREIATEVFNRAVRDDLDGEQTAALTVRKIAEAGRSDELFDDCESPADEQRVFDLYQKAPVEIVPGPHDHLTDRQLEKAMQGGVPPGDREVAPGVFLTTEYTNDPKAGYEQLKREVAELDAEAAKKAADRDDDDPNGFTRFFRP